MYICMSLIPKSVLVGGKISEKRMDELDDFLLEKCKFSKVVGV